MLNASWPPTIFVGRNYYPSFKSEVRILRACEKYKIAGASVLGYRGINWTAAPVSAVR